MEGSSMNTLVIFLVAVFMLGMSYIVVPFTVDVYRRFNGRKVVTCPGTGRLAEVTLKALRAAIIANFRKPSVRVRSCTLWPKKKGCDEGCVKENWPIY
jgi:hypothetical protein